MPAIQGFRVLSADRHTAGPMVGEGPRLADRVSFGRGKVAGMPSSLAILRARDLADREEGVAIAEGVSESVPSGIILRSMEAVGDRALGDVARHEDVIFWKGSRGIATAGPTELVVVKSALGMDLEAFKASLGVHPAWAIE